MPQNQSQQREHPFNPSSPAPSLNRGASCGYWLLSPLLCELCVCPRLHVEPHRVTVAMRLTNVSVDLMQLQRPQQKFLDVLVQSSPPIILFSQQFEELAK